MWLSERGQGREGGGRSITGGNFWCGVPTAADSCHTVDRVGQQICPPSSLEGPSLAYSAPQAPGDKTGSVVASWQHCHNTYPRDMAFYDARGRIPGPEAWRLSGKVPARRYPLHPPQPSRWADPARRYPHHPPHRTRRAALPPAPLPPPPTPPLGRPPPAWGQQTSRFPSHSTTLVLKNRKQTVLLVIIYFTNIWYNNWIYDTSK